MKKYNKIAIIIAVIIMIIQMPLQAMATEYTSGDKEIYTRTLKQNHVKKMFARLVVDKQEISQSGDEINFNIQLKTTYDGAINESKVSSILYTDATVQFYVSDENGNDLSTSSSYLASNGLSCEHTYFDSATGDNVPGPNATWTENTTTDTNGGITYTCVSSNKYAYGEFTSTNENPYVDYMKFTVKTTSLSSTDDFYITLKLTQNVEDEKTPFTYPVKISVSTGTVEPVEPAYEIAAKPSAESAYVDDTFKVDVVASANQTADLAAVDAVLNYDKDLVKPTAVETKNLTKGEALYYTNGTNGVTTEGQGKIATYGDTASVGTDGLVVATYTFEALKAGTATFSIADGAKVGKSGETAEFAATSAAAASVEINEVPDEKILISNDVYKGAPTGKQVLKYISKNMPAEGSAYFYGDDTAPLYYAGDNDEGKHVFLGFVDSTLTLDTLGTVSEKTGTYETLAYDGDLNVTGSVNAIDALIAYDLSNSIYAADTDMSKLSAKARLNADINKDGAVTAADARAILYKGLGINDPSKTN